MQRPHQNKDLLDDLYTRQKYSMKGISKLLNCNQTTIFKYIRRYNIPTRPPREGRRPIFIFDKNLIQNLYSIHKKSAFKISKMFKCSEATIRNYLHKHNIPVRGPNDLRVLNLNKELLYDLYKIQEKTIWEIGKILNCHGQTVLNYLHKYNIPVRSHSKSLKGKYLGRPVQRSKRIYYKGICMHSTWEAKIAQLADQAGIEWLYEPKRFYFEDCSYLPDFYFPKWNLWVEVKGWMTGESKKRIDLFKKYYPKENLLVIDKNLYEKYCIKEKLWKQRKS